ncbi:MAG: c-type cytochrome [Gemmobacter sp.]
MRNLTKSAVIALTLFATVAIAADATDPAAKARQELMDMIGANAKILGDMAGGKAPFEATAAEAAKAVLVAASAEIAAKFEPQTSDPKSKVKPEIWSDWAGFTAAADKLNAAASALGASTVEGVQAGMEAVGGTCGSCHKAYRL